MSHDGTPIDSGVALVTGGHRGFGRAMVDELLDRGGPKIYASSRTQSSLLDRRSERAALDRLVGAVRAGESRALVVRGDPGVGKSILLDYVAEQATGCRIVHATGIESEMELAFAGLHQLCAPLLTRLGRLPAPQGDALATAFGLRTGEAPDRFLVGLAVLSLFGEVADERPLVCLVDDAQWLDRASAQVLGFVARRLVAESVGLIFGSRQPSEDSELKGLTELVVEGLAPGDARALLESVVAGPMDDRVRDCIIAETVGNPLALVELPHGRNPAELAGGFGVPGPGVVSARVKQSFAGRAERMPAATQRLLLIAAAEPMGDPTLLFHAANLMGLDVADGLRGADDLLTVNGGVRFRHPLVRSAVYRAASETDRRRVHAALAEPIAPEEDEDRRAWHRAQSAALPDDAVAAELEASAARAAHGAGAADAASTLLTTARRGPLAELEGAQCKLLGAEIAFSSGRGRDAASLLVAAATQLEPLDAGLARAAYLEAIWAGCFAMHLASPTGALEASKAAQTAPRALAAPTPEDLMLDGLTARFVDGYPAGAPTLHRVGGVQGRGAHRRGRAGLEGHRPGCGRAGREPCRPRLPRARGARQRSDRQRRDGRQRAHRTDRAHRPPPRLDRGTMRSDVLHFTLAKLTSLVPVAAR